MARNPVLTGAVLVLLLGSSCAPKRVAAPPPPQVKQNVIALLPEPDGVATAIVVTNQGGTQQITQSNQAVRVQSATVAPSAPFAISDPDVRRLFGAALDVMPAAEIRFVLHFDEGRDVLNAESQAQIPAVLTAIRDRRSTAITVTGHTDTTSTPDFNFQLGLRRAQNVATILRNQGVSDSDLFVSSHGDADLLVPTPRNTAEAQNRRVEVIVR